MGGDQISCTRGDSSGAILTDEAGAIGRDEALGVVANNTRAILANQRADRTNRAVRTEVDKTGTILVNQRAAIMAHKRSAVVTDNRATIVAHHSSSSADDNSLRLACDKVVMAIDQSKAVNIRQRAAQSCTGFATQILIKFSSADLQVHRTRNKPAGDPRRKRSRVQLGS